MMPPPPRHHAPLSVRKFAFRIGMGRRCAQRELSIGVERLLNGAPARRVIERRGQRQAGRIGDSGNTLCTRPLPKLGSPTIVRAVVILQRARHDLRRAGALAVDQHRHRKRRMAWRPSGTFSFFLRNGAAAHRQQFRKPGFRNSDAVCSAEVSSPPGLLRRSSTRPFSFAPPRLFDGLLNLLAGLFVEAGDAQSSRCPASAGTRAPRWAIAFPPESA